MAEKRKFNRYSVNFKIFISTVDKKNQNTTLHVDSVNISASGILFHFHENIKTGTDLFLSFYPLNESEEFVAEARVVRSKKKNDNEYAVAAHFTIFEKGDESILNDILHNHNK